MFHIFSLCLANPSILPCLCQSPQLLMHRKWPLTLRHYSERLALPHRNAGAGRKKSRQESSTIQHCMRLRHLNCKDGAKGDVLFCWNISGNSLHSPDGREKENKLLSRREAPQKFTSTNNEFVAFSASHFHCYRSFCVRNELFNAIKAKRCGYII